MDIYVPTLEGKMLELVVAFRIIVFAIMVLGLVCHVGAGNPTGASIVRTLAKALVIVAAVATMDRWFPKTEDLLLQIAEHVNPGYKDAPDSAASTIRESTTTDPEGEDWSWRDINQSIYQAVTKALANIFIYIGTLITVPMLILQYVLRWLLYMLTPFALALFMVPGFKGIGVRFLQQLLAILAWPVGFALTNLVALAVWTDFRGAVGPNPETIGDAMYSPFLTMMGGILATIMIVIGMVSTPVVMQMLFAQGVPFTGGSVSPTGMVRNSTGLVAGLASRLGGGAAAARGPSAASTAAAAATGGRSLPSAPPPPSVTAPGI
jgi:hypothetical protein